MLTKDEATKIVSKELPNGKIQACVPYKNLYLFQVFSDDPFEEEMDPFFSVNQQTGEFKDFSILTDGDISEITRLFDQYKNSPTKEEGNRNGT